jgi:hypothetical protein
MCLHCMMCAQHIYKAQLLPHAANGILCTWRQSLLSQPPVCVCVCLCVCCACRHYHASLSAEQREEVQSAWSRDELQVGAV